MWFDLRYNFHLVLLVSTRSSNSKMVHHIEFPVNKKKYQLHVHQILDSLIKHHNIPHIRNDKYPKVHIESISISAIPFMSE